DTYLFKTPYVFDVSVSELFGWFLGGGRLAILGHGDERDPFKITGAIERLQVTHINFVPSMFNVFVDWLNRQTIRQLDTLKYIFLAGEALLPNIVNKFRKLDSKNKIRLENIYGPTEGTIYAAKYSLAQWNGRTTIPIGKPMQNVKLHITGKSGNLQPPGVTGQLCISGKGLARGYLNRPELTAETFDRTNKSCSADILYKTGDLARRLPDGNIEFLGRIDHQVKIRGFRIELGEIETQLLKHPLIKEVAVQVRESEKTGNSDLDSRDKFMCAYIVPQSTDSPLPGPAKLKEFLSRSLPGYMIPPNYMEMEKIPLTSSGKIDGKALAHRYVSNVKLQGEYTAPRNETEEKLTLLLADVLSVEEKKISIDSNFFELGGHSLKAVVLISKIHKEFNVIVPMARLFKEPTVRGLAACIKEAAPDIFETIEAVEKKEYYPLSSPQKRLYILQQMELNSTVYNMPTVIPLGETADMEKLEDTFKKLIKRHESLRTFFHMKGDEPLQRIHDTVEFEMETDGSGKVRPFDLSKAPLLRAGILKTTEDQYLLGVDMHHIISDGISHGILVKDYAALYGGETLPPLRIQYKDFSEWQNKDKEKENIKQQEAYWLNEFNGELPAADIQTDYPRPAVRSFEGDVISFEISEDHSNALKAIALEEKTTLFMVMLALYNILLSRLTGLEDIIA
ncbi:MAG: AMP-binding protein, partial [bacterium]|nr:AMP-binding protein [bacterium]